MIDDLPELENLIDEIQVEEVPRFFNEEESLEIYDTCIFIMEEFIQENGKLISEPDFDDIFDENISELMHCHFDFDAFYTEEAQEEMDEIIEHAKKDFHKYHFPLRSYPNTIILKKPDYEYVDRQIDILKSKPQPAQRTKEWYEFRRNLITASNAYKAFESQSSKNQLIYEKCQQSNSIITNDDDMNDGQNYSSTQVQVVNINSTLHWGQKYEPISVMIYESTYDTKIGDFGCIQHDDYRFLGASPDGINIEKKSPRYGRMLEIKNIVNREIDGIPKKEYWIQMQLQMEVCKLDECDFLETRFVEYPDFDSFIQDSDTDDDEETKYILTKDGKHKGIILYFHTDEGKPFYSYKPLNISKKEDIELWEENTINQYTSEPYNFIYMRYIYWKLEEYSCVLVQRNDVWFKDNVKELEDIWQIIEKERDTGEYINRAPNKKQKKDISTSETDIVITKLDISTNEGLNDKTQNSGCLLKFFKKTSDKVDTNINVIKSNSDSNHLILDLDLDIDKLNTK